MIGDRVWRRQQRKHKAKVRDAGARGGVTIVNRPFFWHQYMADYGAMIVVPERPSNFCINMRDFLKRGTRWTAFADLVAWKAQWYLRLVGYIEIKEIEQAREDGILLPNQFLTNPIADYWLAPRRWVEDKARMGG